ncbi:MAG TPA: nitrous oxide reductase family maturation protein NosD [Chitinophagaceae bacterium]
MRLLAIILIFFSGCSQHNSGESSRPQARLPVPEIASRNLNIAANVQPSGNVIVVGKGQQFSSLKDAIAKAKSGDTIVLQQGIYREGNIVLTKAVTILGQNYPVLDGEKKHEIITISGSNIKVSGIHFKDCGQSAMNDFASVKLIDSRNIIISDNKITDSYFGIHISNSKDCTIQGNAVSGTPTTEQNTGNGIHLWKCENILIEENFISGHRDGIYFEFVTRSLIKNNISDQNIRYGIHFMFSHHDRYIGNTFRNNGAGVAVMYSNNVHMEDNHFEKNWGAAAYGILLKEISDSHIARNTFNTNTVAILMEGTNRIEVKQNSFRENGCAMRVQASCNDNTIHDNNFFGNTFDVATNGTMMLNRFYNNYWDKYEGYDMNRDGIGDVPYHPVSMYAMIIEQNPNALILMRSFIVQLLDKAEKAIPSLTPEDLADEKPMLKPLKL